MGGETAGTRSYCYWRWSNAEEMCGATGGLGRRKAGIAWPAHALVRNPKQRHVARLGHHWEDDPLVRVQVLEVNGCVHLTFHSA